MKIKNYQVFDSRNKDAINELMKADLKGVTALKVVKVARKLDELFKELNETVNIIRDRYTAKNDDGSIVYQVDENGKEDKNFVKIADPETFQKELNEIMDIENEIFPDMQLITEDELSTIKIAPNTILLLEWMIDVK